MTEDLRALALELVEQGLAMDMASAIAIVTDPKNGFSEVTGDPFR